MGKNSEFLVFMDAEDSSEGLVKVATRTQVYILTRMCRPEFYILHEGF